MRSAILSAACAVLAFTSAANAWEPTKPIEIIVPFPPGGSSDQMARSFQGIAMKHQFVKQPILIVNKVAAAGGEAMMEIRKATGDAHKLLTTSSGIYMTPLSSKLQVSWKDFTPIAMLAQDDFVVWVNADTPYKTAGEFVAAAKAADKPFRIGGNGAKREDNLITFMIEQTTGAKIAYIPFAGGGPTSVQLQGKHIEANVNNPAEEVANWRAGTVRPVCVLSTKRMTYTAKITSDQAWADIPPCVEQGLDVTYQMLRGMFMPGKVTPEQQAYYVEIFRKVSETSEWKEYLERNALQHDFRAGQEFVDFLTEDEERHRDLMGKAGFLAAE